MDVRSSSRPSPSPPPTCLRSSASLCSRSTRSAPRTSILHSSDVIKIPEGGGGVRTTSAGVALVVNHLSLTWLPLTRPSDEYYMGRQMRSVSIWETKRW